MYSENTTRNRQGRQSVVIFGLALAMILVMGSMTVSYGTLSFEYESPTEAELYYTNNDFFGKIKIVRDGTVIFQRSSNEHLPMSGIFDDQFSRGVHQYKIEYYFCEGYYDTPPYDCITYSSKPYSTDILPTTGYTYGTVRKNRTLSGENKMKDGTSFPSLRLVVCSGVQLTIKDADLSSIYGGFIVPFGSDDTSYSKCNPDLTGTPKVVIDNSTLGRVTISGVGAMSGDSVVIKTIPMELSVTNSRLNFPISPDSYSSYIGYVILTNYQVFRKHHNAKLSGSLEFSLRHY